MDNTNEYKIRKYPRTPHLKGSKLGEGDEDLSQLSFDGILGRHIVIEEKIDGANCAVSFDGDGNLLLQSRGHYLTGGYRERHYNLLKQWANENCDALFSALEDRYIMYGEWMYAKHTVFYDALPDYFMEFDIFDRKNGVFLDTGARGEITRKIGIISSVPVLAQGVFKNKKEILSCLGHSLYITDAHIDALRKICEDAGLDAEKIIAETDPGTMMEGLYIKVEEGGIVTERMKFVRQSFSQCAEVPQSNWHSRPIIPNKLKDK